MSWGKAKATNSDLTDNAQHADVNTTSCILDTQQRSTAQVLFTLNGLHSENHGKSDQNLRIALLHLATLKIPTTIMIARPLGTATSAHSWTIGPSSSFGSVVIESSVATKLSGMKKVASQVSHSSEC